MNANRYLKRALAAIAATGLLLGATTLGAQSVNPQKLQQIRDYISMIRHPDQVDMLPRIRQLAGGSGEEYLLAIAGDSSQRAAVRMRAIGLLSAYPESAAVRQFLESSASNGSLNASYRTLALSAYVRAFYARDPARVRGVVQRNAGDSSAEMQGHAGRILVSMDAGSRSPAGERRAARSAASRNR